MNQLNHSSQPGLIAVNLNQYRELAQRANQPLLDVQTLKKLLPHSRRHKYVANKVVRSRILEKTINCWVFQQ